MKHIKIVRTKGNTVASLEIDGKPAKTEVLERLQFVGVELPSDDLPTVTLKYRPSEVDIEIELEELPATEVKTFMGLEVRTPEHTSKVVEGLKSLGNGRLDILNYLTKNDLIVDEFKEEAYATLRSLYNEKSPAVENVKQFLHEDFQGNKVIKSDEDWGWDL